MHEIEVTKIGQIYPHSVANVCVQLLVSSKLKAGKKMFIVL